MAWVLVEQVEAALGAGTDDPFLQTCTDAANAWAFRRRATSGYTDDPDVSPGPDAELGVITYAMVLYRERGSVDSYASFDEFATGIVPSSTVTQALRLLGIPKPMVDKASTDPPAGYRRLR
jgi:hypothetical protein